MTKFDIREHVQFGKNRRAQCPACLTDGKDGLNLEVTVGGTYDGAYKCWRQCSPDDIRAALGAPKPQQIPTAIAQLAPIKDSSVGEEKIAEAQDRLNKSTGAARLWLHTKRGFTDELISHYRIGVTRAKVKDQMLWAITIPIPVAPGRYVLKKRVAPWLEESERPDGYKPWSQHGISARIFYTWQPPDPVETWIFEGEWDAMLIGWMARDLELPVTVASGTSGCDTVPPASELAQLGDRVVIFFDRNDKPTKRGIIPGDHGAKQWAKALGDRARLALVPMPDNCTTHGWDATDAVQAGFTLEDFLAAARDAVQPQTEEALEPQKFTNPLKQRLQWNDELLDTAPDHTEWLVPDLLTQEELFLMFTPPRKGKSLWAMTLARSVATGEPFLGRPTTQGTVIYARLEDSAAKTKEREIAQGWDRGLPVAWIDQFGLTQTDFLEALVEETDARLVVIDTLSRANDTSISESSAEIAQVIAPLQNLASRQNCCVLLVHHSRKLTIDNADQTDVFENSRGSTAIRATCRGMLAIASGEHSDRLFAENGWGRHDLSVRLNPGTLRWELLGNWNPTINGDQRTAVLDYLRHREHATIDQISADLVIPKKSLYTVLDRLRVSEVPAERVHKRGARRNYVYQLGDPVIQQLNMLLNSDQSTSNHHPQSDTAPREHKPVEDLLNSANPCPESNTAHYSTKNNIFYPCENGSTGSTDQRTTFSTTKSDTPSDPNYVDVDPSATKGINGWNQAPEGILATATTPSDPVDPFSPEHLLLNRGSKQGQNLLHQRFCLFNKTLLTIQLLNSEDHWNLPSILRCITAMEADGGSLPDHSGSTEDQRTVTVGDKATYSGSDWRAKKMFGRKQLEVLSLQTNNEGRWATVHHPAFQINQTLALSDLKPVTK
jgi:hypothetical protein